MAGATILASACPDCFTSEETWARIERDPAFWSNLLGLAAPLLLIGAMAAIYQSGLIQRFARKRS